MSQAQGRKPDIASFFIRSQPGTQTVPQKRASPSDERPVSGRPSKARNPTPRTPVTSSRYKNVATSPLKSPFGPGSAKSLSMPIRSPRPPNSNTKSVYGPGPLFRREESFLDSSPIPPSPKTQPPSPVVVIPTTKQSVIKDGKTVLVRDSDEDTESLESLEDIFGRRQDDSTTSTSSPPELNEAMREAERKSVLSLFIKGRSEPLVGKDKLRELIAKQRASTFNIHGLLDDHFGDDEVEQKLRQARDGYEASATVSERWGGEQDGGRSLLASVVRTDPGEEDGMSRLMDAVERTEALSPDTRFSFFGSKGINDWQDEVPHRPDFPKVSVKGVSPDSDAEARDRAYLSGFLAETASRDWVDDAVLCWTFENVVLEERDELRNAYVRCLQDSSVHWTRTNLTATDVQHMFQTLGADAVVLRDASAIEPRAVLQGTHNRDPKYLLSALELFRGIAQDMDFTALSKLTSLLARLAVDAEVMSNVQISTAVEDSLSALLDLPDTEARHLIAERLLSDTGQHLKERMLQARLLNHILPSSPFAAKVRISLAKRFLIGPSGDAGIESDKQLVSLSALTEHLHGPEFDITIQIRHDSTDYAKLKAATQLLDTAISDGGRPFFASRHDEVAFNRQVDVLADRIKIVFTSIADTGASHMRRTEAKEAMQALYYRLLYAVRTEPRPKKNVFGGRDGDECRAEQRSKDFLHKFLAKQKERKALQESDGNLIAAPCTAGRGGESRLLVA